MSILKNITLRYQSQGHVRFQIPEILTDPAVQKLLMERILKLEGVYRIRIYAKQQKLSIQYQHQLLEFKALAGHLYQIIQELDEQGLLVPSVVEQVQTRKSAGKGFKDKLKDLKAARWVNDKYSDVQETVQAAKVVTRIGLKKPKAFIKDPEKALIDFLNDILVLYLIKIHWTRITQDWLPKPWVHRYEWTAVFYLFYLLMRSRKPK